ncbi:trypsin-like peptidase domain-containing protein [Pedobacter sp. SD-b]|uniref:Trypsin-like peptidase domain-containing protein n=1 Tax=Pedobacter segetis TaxID=2793069 RepID=A0ABS1BJ43_9SPHI|nr:serine protease [Pedobacter segetis]MBK0382376.1 trypsin-like peptidase domain-containing protein [Pedobacter segetis]
MKSEIDLIKEIEAYLFKEMDAKQAADFEDERISNPSFDKKVTEHFNFLQSLKSYGDKKALKIQMGKIHEEIDLDALKEEFNKAPSKIISFWRKTKRSLAVAASIAILFTLSTLYFTGQFDGQNHVSNYSELKRDMETIKRSQRALINNINSSSNQPSDNSQYGGTGFALSSNGYLVTNYHVVKGADSVYVQNGKGESFKVETIYIDPTYDIAILQIIDPLFKNLSPLPYTFKKSNADLGEDVYTIGYPKDDIVYGKGYLSSSTGYGGDSTAYQISIPVNPGNSGGPLMDNKGNVIGIVSGKQTQADGAAFAVKSDFLLKCIGNIPQDSLKEKININKKNTLAGLNRTAQIKKMQDYIFIVKVYN